ARPAVEDLEDLHALTGPHTQIGHECARVDTESVVNGDALNLRARRGPDTVQLLGAEDDVLGDGEVVSQHEVLEDHPDTVLDRIGRAVEGDLLAIDPDDA